MLGLTVRKLRRAKGLTLRALAVQADLSYQTVHRIERGEGSSKAALSVLTTLGVPSKTRLKLLVKRLEA